MITPSELGIDESTWDALILAVEDVAFEANIYQWNPDFLVDLAGTDDNPDFSAVLGTNGLYHGNDAGVSRYDGSWTDLTLSPLSGAVGAPSFVMDDTDLIVYQRNSSGISQNTYSGSWSGWSSVVSNSTIVFMAATGVNAVHFITLDGSDRYRFHYWNGASVIDSDIYYGFPIHSFAAVRGTEGDTLIIAAETPGIISTTVTGTIASKEYIPSGGLVAFPFRSERWGDHWFIDPVDQWSSYRYRTNVKVSQIGNQLVLLAYSAEGTQRTQITGYRIYTSMDGLHWSRGELMPFPYESSQGLLLAGYGNLLFGLTYDGRFLAPMTLRFGDPAETTHYHLPNTLVRNVNLSRGDMQQVTLAVDNVNNTLEETILYGSERLALQFALIANGIRVQQGLFEVDTVEPVFDMPQTMLTITARDRLAWLADQSQSEQFRNWQPQIVAGDNYRDDTGTGYGGMTHTAPAKESWKAHDGQLELVSSNKQGIAFSTYLNDNWNGATETWLRLATSGNNEYAGLVFRAQDVDNYWTMRYDDSTDVITLREVRGGTEDTKWTSSSMGWDAVAAGKWIRVEYRYCEIRMYTSTAGDADPSVTWTHLHTYLAVGGEATSPINQAGYTGVIGWGYAPEEEFPESPLLPFPAPYPAFVPPEPIFVPPIGEEIPWEIEFDLMESLGGWSVASEGGAVWAEGIGVYDAGGSGGRIALVERSFGTPFKMTGLKVEYRTVSADYSPTHYASYRGELDSVLVNQQTGDVSTTNGAIRIYTFEDTDIVEDLIDYVRLGAVLTPAGTFQSASVRLRKFTIYGKGYYPF